MHSNEHKGFLCYDQSEKRMRISRNVIFLEQIPFFFVRLDSPIAMSYLPQFLKSASPSTLPKVYVRRNTVPPMVPPLPEHLPVPPAEPSCNNASSDNSIPLRCSSRLFVAPNRYGFPTLYFFR